MKRSRSNDNNSEEIPEILPATKFRRSRHELSPNVQMPKRKVRVALEADLLAWFQAQERCGGLDCEEHINKALRQYVINPIGDRTEAIVSREALEFFAEKTLGIWADDPKVKQAFAELEAR